MRNYLFTLLFAVLHAGAFCQTPTETARVLRKADYLSVQLNPILSSSLKIANSGADLINSKRLFSGEIGLGYSRELSENWMLNTSFNIGLLPYNLNFEFDAPENSIFQTGPYKEDYKTLDFNWSEYEYIRLYSAIDAVVTRRILTMKSGDEVSVGAGLRAFVFLVNEFEYEYYSTWYIDENNPEVQLFYANVNDTSSNRLNGSILLETNYTKHLKNNHQLKVALSMSYSPFTSARGYYYFSHLGFSSSGTLTHNTSYVSLKLSYLMPLKSRARATGESPE